MKVTINGSVNKESLKGILNTQKTKEQIIDDFCQENKFNHFYYKDSELEYELNKTPKSKVEVRQSG